MKKEYNGKRMAIHLILGIVLSISAVMFFLFSIKSILLSEAESKLLAITKKIGVNLDTESEMVDGVLVLEEKEPMYLNSKVYRYVTDEDGKVAVSYGVEANQLAKVNNYLFTQFLEDFTKQKKQLVKKITLASGQDVYISVVKVDATIHPYTIGIVDAVSVDQDIHLVWIFSIIVIVCAIITLTFAFLYSTFQRKKKQRKLQKQGKPDPVTNLLHYVRHKARAQELMNAEKHTYAYVTFTIDNYQLIYELSGREYCDYLLKSVADILTNWIGNEETLTRYHDDWFGMMLIYDDELKFRQRLLRMLKHAGDIPNYENSFFKITFHSGVCVVTNERDINQVIHNSRKARNNSVSQAPGCIQFYNTSVLQDTVKKSIEEVSNALYDNEFEVFFQPKYRVESEDMTGAEALIRWRHPKNGLLSPNVFLPLLEETKMVTQIDYYVIQEVCNYLKQWKAAGKVLVPISINLSIQHLDHYLFVQEIIDIVDSYGIQHDYLEFEFPENAVYEKMTELVESMKILESAGFTISLDNFGAGVSALHLLKDLPIHVIKIDKGLIKDYEDIEFSNQDRTLVTHIISYAKARNVEVVAEGVETKEQRDILQKQQCDIIQGYYYHKPMKASDFKSLLAE